MNRTFPRAESIFTDALALPAAKRDAFLDDACAGDATLRARVAALLSAHTETSSLLVPVALHHSVGDEEKSGDTIGRYKLLQRIGEGGCGVVWMAGQEEPVRRRVALKVIKLGMDTRQVIARFEAERQALAMMDHPNIAKVHDAGSTDTGRPYFVMELVRGIPIAKYCDENQLTPAARLELFIKVCQAVQHAHQKGIIHRDLKPSNILVTVNDGTPMPKIIDFGIAKATQGRLTDATVFTAFEQFIGTPAYMSPEQAEMSSVDIDTRSDIYSLGVLLYELLTGRQPFDPKNFAAAGVDQIRRQIREIDPPRPSARLHTLTDEEQTTIAKLRGTASSNLSIMLRGDLDWIVMRCIEKDRTRRYDTANGLAMDIQRYLRNEPVVARPPSTAYLLKKLIRRHRVGFGAALAISVALVLGAIVSTLQAVRATRAEREQARLRSAAEQSEQEQSVLRARAEVGERAAKATASALRRTAYVAEMNIAQQALVDGNLAKARMLLDKYRPAPGEEEIRGFEWRYLWAQSRGAETATVANYRGGFGGVAISPDGSLLATIGPDNASTVEIRALPGRQLIRVLPDTSGGQSMRLLRFSPDGQWLVAAGDASNRSLRRWSTGRWTEEPILQGAQSPLAFTHDGKRMIACEGDRFFVWSTETWTTLGQLPGTLEFDYLSRNTGECLAISVDARTVYFSGAPNRGIRVWDLERFVELEPLAPALETRTPCLALSRHGLLAAGDQDANVTVWDTKSRQILHRLQSHQAWVTAVAFSDDGATLASTGADQTIVLHDAATGKTLRRLIGHEGEIWSIAFSPNGKSLVSGSKYDGTAKVWPLDRETGAPAYVSPFMGLAFVGSGRELVGWSQREGFSRFDMTSGHRTRLESQSVPVEFGPERFFETRLSSDLNFLANIHGSGVEIWNLRSGQCEQILRHAEGAITALAFSADGRLLATAGENSEVRIWHTRDWSAKVLSSVIPGTASLGAVSFSPQGNRLAARIGATCYVFDLQSEILPIELHPFGDIHFTFSPDGNRIAVGSRSNFIELWDITAKKQVAVLRGHMAGVLGLSFAPDGRTLASCSNDNFVRLWSLDPLAEVLRLPGIRAASGEVMFSPDGNSIVANSSGERMQIWRAPSWDEIAATEKTQAVKTGNP